MKKRILLGLGARLPMASLANSAGNQLMAEIGPSHSACGRGVAGRKWLCVSCLAHTFSHMLAADTQGQVAGTGAGSCGCPVGVLQVAPCGELSPPLVMVGPAATAARRISDTQPGNTTKETAMHPAQHSQRAPQP